MNWILRNKWLSLALIVPLLSLKGDGNPNQVRLDTLQESNDLLKEETLFQESVVRNLKDQARYKDSIGPKDYSNTIIYEGEYLKGSVDPFYFDNRFIYSAVAEKQ